MFWHRVEFTCTARATIREKWACSVPNHVVDEGPDAVYDYLDQQLETGGAEFLSEETLGDEEARQLEPHSYKHLFKAKAER